MENLNGLIKSEEIEQLIWLVVNQFLIPKFNELGMKASGQWLDALSVKVNGNRGEIWGTDYTQYLVNGRANGKRPPIQVLEKWVNDKFGVYGQEAKSMAFAIGNKIAKEGTSYYPQGTDLLEVLESNECQQFINLKSKEIYLKSVSLEIVRLLKTIK